MPTSNENYFEAKLVDVSPKAPLCLMEFPFFAVNAKRKNLDSFVWRDENRGLTLKIKPTDHGRMTIHDLDVLIFITSQLIAAKNHSIKTSKNICFNANRFHEMTKKKGVNGDSQNEQLFASLKRIASTHIETNISVNDYIEDAGFNFFSYRVVRDKTKKRMMHVEITLCDWLYTAISTKTVRTLKQEYFLIKSPLKRRLYLLADQHLYKGKAWKIQRMKLYEKSGSQSSFGKFNFRVKQIQRIIDIVYELTNAKVITARRQK